MLTQKTRRPSSLSAVFRSPAMARLVVFFIVHPHQRFHLRELMRRTQLPSASVQAELRRLAGIGALSRADEGGRAIYAADEGHDAWRAWMLLIRACANPVDVVREALVDADGIVAAFAFGSSARADLHESSDLDLFLVGDAAAQEHAGRLLAECSILLTHEIDATAYDRDELASRIAGGNTFVRRVLDGPKRWLRGDARALQRVDAA